MAFFFKQAGRCTRCGEPFADNRAIAFMVSEMVAWSVMGPPGDETALTQRETVPVCSACVTPREEAAATRETTCAGCGQAMRSALAVRTCCSRCYQRELRARWRDRARGFCAACGQSFKPKRADARYCSPACKQRAWRARAVEVATRENRESLPIFLKTICDRSGVAEPEG
jgi:hypothetical protein